MLTITADKAVFGRLAALLKDEDEGICIRLKEYIIGGG